MLAGMLAGWALKWPSFEAKFLKNVLNVPTVRCIFTHCSVWTHFAPLFTQNIKCLEQKHEMWNAPEVWKSHSQILWLYLEGLLAQKTVQLAVPSGPDMISQARWGPCVQKGGHIQQLAALLPQQRCNRLWTYNKIPVWRGRRQCLAVLSSEGSYQRCQRWTNKITRQSVCPPAAAILLKWIWNWLN